MDDLGDFETTIKVIVVGNGGVGKSSMTARYCKGIFTDNYKKTIGVDFLEKSIDLTKEDGDAETVKLMVWDTAGQEEFDALTSTYYKGAGACAIVFSTIDRASFDAVESWKRKVEEECGPIIMALVHNKVDLIAQAKMTTEEVEAKAAALGLPLFRTCVKDNLNIAQVFESMAARYINSGGDTSEFAAISAAANYGSQQVAPLSPGGAAQPSDEDGADAAEGMEEVIAPMSPGGASITGGAPLSPVAGTARAAEAAVPETPQQPEEVITMTDQEFEGEGGVISAEDVKGEFASPAGKTGGAAALASPEPLTVASPGAGSEALPVFSPSKAAVTGLGLQLDAEERLAANSRKGACGACVIC